MLNKLLAYFKGRKKTVGFILQPIFDKVIIEPIQSKETTSQGLYIPDSIRSKEQPITGIVVAVAKECKFMSPSGNYIHYIPQVKVGDKVMYEQNRMTKIVVQDKEYYVMREDNIFTQVFE